MKYLGNIITKSPTIPTAAIAKGIWRLEEAAYYRGKSTWPTTYLDPYFTNVSLLVRGNTSASVFVDSSLNSLSITSNGNVASNTTTFKYGTSSVSFDGNGDYLSLAYTPLLDLIGSDFTIECWVYATSFKSFGTRIFSTGGGTAGWNSTTGIHILLQASSTGNLDFQIASGTSTPRSLVTTGSFSINTWTHVAASYVNSTNTIYLAINGTVQSSVLSAPSRPSTNPITNIASIPGEAGLSTYALSGYIDDLRVTKGTARYTSSFTAPTAEFPNT